MCDHVQTEAMKEYESNQYDPYLGIGWVQADGLTDISKQISSTCRWNGNGCRTIPVLHKDYWIRHKQKMNHKFHKYDSIYERDYTQIPRFRIFEYKDGKRFRVMVGSWITSEIEEMILDEFELPPEETMFCVDTHWELGHGWSEEYML